MSDDLYAQAIQTAKARDASCYKIDGFLHPSPRATRQSIALHIRRELLNTDAKTFGDTQNPNLICVMSYFFQICQRLHVLYSAGADEETMSLLSNDSDEAYRDFVNAVVVEDGHSNDDVERSFDPDYSPGDRRTVKERVGELLERHGDLLRAVVDRDPPFCVRHLLSDSAIDILQDTGYTFSNKVTILVLARSSDELEGVFDQYDNTPQRDLLDTPLADAIEECWGQDDDDDDEAVLDEDARPEERQQRDVSDPSVIPSAESLVRDLRQRVEVPRANMELFLELCYKDKKSFQSAASSSNGLTELTSMMNSASIEQTETDEADDASVTFSGMMELDKLESAEQILSVIQDQQPTGVTLHLLNSGKLDLNRVGASLIAANYIRDNPDSVSDSTDDLYFLRRWKELRAGERVASGFMNGDSVMFDEASEEISRRMRTNQEQRLNSVRRRGQKDRQNAKKEETPAWDAYEALNDVNPLGRLVDWYHGDKGYRRNAPEYDRLGVKNLHLPTHPCAVTNFFHQRFALSNRSKDVDIRQSPQMWSARMNIAEYYTPHMRRRLQGLHPQRTYNTYLPYQPGSNNELTMFFFPVPKATMLIPLGYCKASQMWQMHIPGDTQNKNILAQLFPAFFIKEHHLHSVYVHGIFQDHCDGSAGETERLIDSMIESLEIPPSMRSTLDPEKLDPFLYRVAVQKKMRGESVHADVHSYVTRRMVLEDRKKSIRKERDAYIQMANASQVVAPGTRSILLSGDSNADPSAQANNQRPGGSDTAPIPLDEHVLPTVDIAEQQKTWIWRMLIKCGRPALIFKNNKELMDLLRLYISGRSSIQQKMRTGPIHPKLARSLFNICRLSALKEFERECTGPNSSVPPYHALMNSWASSEGVYHKTPPEFKIEYPELGVLGNLMMRRLGQYSRTFWLVHPEWCMLVWFCSNTAHHVAYQLRNHCLFTGETEVGKSKLLETLEELRITVGSQSSTKTLDRETKHAAEHGGLTVDNHYCICVNEMQMDLMSVKDSGGADGQRMMDPIKKARLERGKVRTKSLSLNKDRKNSDGNGREATEYQADDLTVNIECTNAAVGQLESAAKRRYIIVPAIAVPQWKMLRAQEGESASSANELELATKEVARIEHCWGQFVDFMVEQMIFLNILPPISDSICSVIVTRVMAKLEQHGFPKNTSQVLQIKNLARKFCISTLFLTHFCTEGGRFYGQPYNNANWRYLDSEMFITAEQTVLAIGTVLQCSAMPEDTIVGTLQQMVDCGHPGDYIAYRRKNVYQRQNEASGDNNSDPAGRRKTPGSIFTSVGPGVSIPSVSNPLISEKGLAATIEQAVKEGKIDPQYDVMLEDDDLGFDCPPPPSAGPPRGVPHPTGKRLVSGHGADKSDMLEIDPNYYSFYYGDCKSLYEWCQKCAGFMNEEDATRTLGASNWIDAITEGKKTKKKVNPYVMPPGKTSLSEARMDNTRVEAMPIMKQTRSSILVLRHLFTEHHDKIVCMKRALREIFNHRYQSDVKTYVFRMTEDTERLDLILLGRGVDENMDLRMTIKEFMEKHSRSVDVNKIGVFRIENPRAVDPLLWKSLFADVYAKTVGNNPTGALPPEYTRRVIELNNSFDAEAFKQHAYDRCGWSGFHTSEEEVVEHTLAFSDVVQGVIRPNAQGKLPGKHHLRTMLTQSDARSRTTESADPAPGTTTTAVDFAASYHNKIYGRREERERHLEMTLTPNESDFDMPEEQFLVPVIEGDRFFQTGGDWEEEAERVQQLPGGGGKVGYRLVPHWKVLPNCDFEVYKTWLFALPEIKLQRLLAWKRLADAERLFNEKEARDRDQGNDDEAILPYPGANTMKRALQLEQMLLAQSSQIGVAATAERGRPRNLRRSRDSLSASSASLLDTANGRQHSRKTASSKKNHKSNVFTLALAHKRKTPMSAGLIDLASTLSPNGHGTGHSKGHKRARIRLKSTKTLVE